MWFLLIYVQICAIQGLDRVVLRGSDSPCSGRLEVFYQKEWGLVCHHGWPRANAKVVCKSLGCGELKNTDKELTLYRDPPPPEKYWMIHIECPPSAKSLKDCKHIKLYDGKCKESFVAIECAGNVKLTLNMNEQTDKCAGVVQFSTQIGVVGICNTGWDEDIANRACKELNCGESFYVPKSDVFEVKPSSRAGELKCIRGKDKGEFLWQCMEWPYNQICTVHANVICTGHRRFRLQNGSHLCTGLVEEYNVTEKLWVPLNPKNVSPEIICAQMNCGATGNFTDANDRLTLTCADTVKLRSIESRCFGSVNVVVNGVDHGVCYSDVLSHNLGKVVCRESNCGDVLLVKRGSWIGNGLLSNVECQGDEESLWHCLAKHKNTACVETTVICSESLDVRLKDGFSNCSGRLEVKLEGTWKSLSAKDWTTVNSDVVCKHLNCGKSMEIDKELFIEENVEKDWVVQCKDSSAKFHECLQIHNNNHNHKPKEIICQKEQLLFFKGDQPCQGQVLKFSFDSMSSSPLQVKEMPSDVCEQMQCETAVVFQNNTTRLNVNTTWPFDNTTRLNVNTTWPIDIITRLNVKCTGSVSVNLSNPLKERCWGTVEVCRNIRCGGVCSKTWRLEESKMLCGNLGCGDPINKPFTFNTQKTNLREYNVFCPKEIKNLSMCHFISIGDSTCSDPASVICQDSVKAQLMDPRDKCAGNVTLFYGGRWMPVCKDSLDKSLQNTVCRELKCGQAESVDVARYEQSQTKGLSGIKCQGEFDSVSQCDFSNLDMKDCDAGYLKCSEWSRLFLYKSKGACIGPVNALRFPKEKTFSKLVSIQGWTKNEGQVLCEYLQCGNYKNHSGESIKSDEWWEKTYNCSGKKKIWECQRDGQSIIEQKQLNIICDGEHPNASLSSGCAGDILIDKKPVCAIYVSKEQIFNPICSNQGCGLAIRHWQRSIGNKTTGWYFSCVGHEAFLWQCYSWEGECNQIISVECEKRVQFSTTKKCGGVLGVKFLNQWQYVCEGITTPDSTKVCEALDCKNGQILNERELNKMMVKDIQLKINCNNTQQNIINCVTLLQNDEKKKCQNKPAEITCKDYVEETPVNIGLIVGILLGILGLLGLISQRNRLLSVLRRYRNKDAKDTSLYENEMNDMETEDKDAEEKLSLFEKDSYEQADAALIHRKEEDDADIKSSSSAGTEYDDIEEQAHHVSHFQTHTENDPGPPLLPERPENLLDEINYEVEIEEDQDYDDAIPLETLANENAEILMTDPPAQADVFMDAETNANTEVVDVDVHTQPE